MGKFVAILGGILAIILGITGIVKWTPFAVMVLKGTIPAFLVLAGLIALIAGIGELKDTVARKEEEKEEPKEEEKEESKEE